MVKKQKHTRNKRKFDVEVVETKDFAGVIDKDLHTGKNKLGILSPVWYQHQLNKFKAGEKVTLYISSKRVRRTMQQNRYYWGVYLPLIAKETGNHDLEQLHTYFKGKFLTTGIVEVFGQKVRMTKSTAELNKNDFSEYIMNIEADTGIEAPPTANYFDK